MNIDDGIIILTNNITGVTKESQTVDRKSLLANENPVQVMNIDDVIISVVVVYFQTMCTDGREWMTGNLLISSTS